MPKEKPPYRLARKPLGVGGFAEVFEAEHRETGERVAFKRLLRKINREEALARLRREIETLRRIDHPHVMPVLDHAADFSWYTMPLADAVLASLEPPIADELLTTIVRECAAGLAAAHDAGLVHRDVTPPNIVRITHDGQARWVIADFGLVRRPRGLTTVVRTMAGSEFGTAGFAAPEAWDDPHAMTAQADIYSLGRVVAWAVTGRLPAPNRSLLPDDEPWRTFVQRATQDEPTARPISMRALVALADGESQPIDPSAGHPNLISGPIRHTVIAQRDVSTGVAKRYSADVLVDRSAEPKSIGAIVRALTNLLRNETSFRDSYSPASQPDRVTDVVFLFVYLSLDDAAKVLSR